MLNCIRKKKIIFTLVNSNYHGFFENSFKTLKMLDESLTRKYEPQLLGKYQQEAEMLNKFKEESSTI